LTTMSENTARDSLPYAFNYNLAPPHERSRGSGSRHPTPPPSHSRPTTPITPIIPAPTTKRDLSNLKLAQNQTELSRQIADLMGAVEGQGKLLRRIMRVLEEEGRIGVGVDGSEGGGEGEGKGKMTQF